VSEQRQDFIRDYAVGIYSHTDLAKAFLISRKTAHKWINRFNEQCKMIRSLRTRLRGRDLPVVSTIAHILNREGFAKKPRRHRRAHLGCPQSVAAGPNDIWAADYKGQFRLRNGQYCFPLTVSDLHSRHLLGCNAHPQVSMERTKQYFLWLFRTCGLPNRIRTDNGVPFATCALARLSQLSAWWIKLGIYPELIEPGKPQQNGIHERMNRTLKQEARIPPSSSLRAQQARFDRFREEFNRDRPHEALQMACPGEVYRSSRVPMPSRIPPYECPGHFVVRRVSRCGTIRVFRYQIFVSQVLNEDNVGLEEVEDGLSDLYFCFYLIGRDDLRRNEIHGIISRVPTAVRSADRPKGCHSCPWIVPRRRITVRMCIGASEGASGCAALRRAAPPHGPSPWSAAGPRHIRTEHYA
jgi:putative transposase